MSRALAPGALSGALRDERARPAVIAAVGPEAFLREQALREIAGTVLGDPHSPDLMILQGALTTTDADQETLMRFFGETRTGSLFGGRKVVALRHADAMVTRYKKDFLAWLSNPGSAALPVILADDLPRPVMTVIEKMGMVVKCGGQGSRSQPPLPFIAERAAARGKRIGRAEAELLLELLGPGLTGLENSVEILSLHAGEREEIGRGDIEALFQSGREGSVWAFGDLLVAGRVSEAMNEASRCFNEGIPTSARSRKMTRDEGSIAVRLVLAFTTAVCRVLDVRAQLDAGVSRREVKINGPWSARQSTMQVISRRRPPALQALAVFAEETDRGLKSGGPAGRAAIARLVAAVSRVP